MAITPYSAAPAESRLAAMRTAWRPVGQRLSQGTARSLDWLSARPPLVQGFYYLLTGVWPWIHMRSFLWVTGPKTDLWLVQTVGVLVAVIGLALIVAGARRESNVPVVCLAVGSALGLGLAEVLFVVHGRIPLIYLADAVLEGGLVALWIYALRQHRYTLSHRCEDAPVAQPAPPCPPAAGPVGATVAPAGYTVMTPAPGLGGGQPVVRM